MRPQDSSLRRVHGTIVRSSGNCIYKSRRRGSWHSVSLAPAEGTRAVWAGKRPVRASPTEYNGRPEHDIRGRVGGSDSAVNERVATAHDRRCSGALATVLQRGALRCRGSGLCRRKRWKQRKRNPRSGTASPAALHPPSTGLSSRPPPPPPPRGVRGMEAAAEDVEEDADGAEVDGTAGRGGVSMR
ncbi:hypothetical protein C7M84_024940 [Penaeus vannamei]|uniref:Uncharacterized protein n=1 Tax=Penaeus vannamei TaxID=6689 RepID=A0A3R7QKP7_PENVA|nr:hypothetical protein C7M84_024940 [Penaeus vannamei]